MNAMYDAPTTAPARCRRTTREFWSGVRMADTVNIEELLLALGYDQAAGRKAARAVLEKAGLTRPGKSGIAAYKRHDAEAALAAALIRVCGPQCAALAPAGKRRREPVVSGSHTCEICHGSNNRRAAITCARILRASGVERVLVVGGTAVQQHELAGLMPSRVKLDFVDGTARSHTTKEAIANMNRVQLVAIWGATPLRHAVSDLYTSNPPPHLRVVSVSKRGIEALCNAMAESYRRVPERGRSTQERSR